MFAAKLTNKTVSDKQGEYIVKVSYKHEPAQYLCGCEGPKGNRSASFTSIPGNLFYKEVKIFPSTKAAKDYLSIAFQISDNPSAHRLTIMKRPKQVYIIKYGASYLIHKNPHSVTMNREMQYAKLFFNQKEAERVAESLNRRNYTSFFSFEVIMVTEENLK
ncbi:MAG: hypothetical protein K2K81_10290 [Muribaculaceae bacterium]|nr:hypothetical protein [Muribaculaceae bacterium]